MAISDTAGTPSDAASAAALLVTRQHQQSKSQGASSGSHASDGILGPDGKLSSKSAATSLKYAKPQDLPSFPSRGLDSSSAGAAAVLAKDYKAREMQRPEASSASSKAAHLANKDGGKVDLWQASPSSEGHSAATLAMRNKTLSPQLDYGHTELGKSNSLLAATKVVHQQSRARAGSNPAPAAPDYPDSSNAQYNALNAATSSTKDPVRLGGNYSDPAMFGERPPVEIEVEEKKREAALRASAVSMAKQMMEAQKRAPSEAGSSSAANTGAENALGRVPSNMSQSDLRQEAIKYIGVENAAYKLAQVRIAKVDKDLEQHRYREHYGFGDSLRKRNSVFGKIGGGGRRSSDARRGVDDDSDDEEQARRIRHQMNQLNSGISSVDDKQRDEDRKRLMAAAEKRVQARMLNMDEKVFQDTGKVSQSMMDDWEAKALERAEKDRTERDRTGGKLHIGGGKFMDQSEVDAIAAARLKPTLDEITENAEKRRAREAEIARERDLAQTKRMNEKMDAEAQKHDWKMFRSGEKAAARQEKEAERRKQQEDLAFRKEALGELPAPAAADPERSQSEVFREQDLQSTAQMNELMRLQNQKEEFRRIRAQDKAREREAKQKAKEERRAEKQRAREAKQAQKARRDEKRRAATLATPVVAGTGATAGGAAATSQQTKDSASVDNVNAAASETQDAEEADHASDESDELSEVSSDSESEAESESEDESSEPRTSQSRSAPPRTVVGGAAGAILPQNPGEVEVKEYSKKSDTKRTSVLGKLKEKLRPTDRHKEGAELAKDEGIVGASQRPTSSGSIGMALGHNDGISGAKLERTSTVEEHISQIDDSDSASEPEDVAETTGIQPLPATRATGLEPLEVTSNDLDEGRPSISPISKGADRPSEGTDAPVSPLPLTEETPAAPGSIAATNPSAAAHTMPVVSPPQDAKEAKTESSSSATPATTAPAITGTASSSNPSRESRLEEEPKEKTGVRRLLSKLKPKKQDDSSKASSSSANKPSVAGASTATTTSAFQEASEGKSTSDDRPDSTAALKSGSVSSFVRGDVHPHDDIDDVSSSGADEDDVIRGRTRGNSGTKRAVPRRNMSDITTSDDGEEHFEEARDTFDEALAPPPAYAGQPKSPSPARETKFQEQL